MKIRLISAALLLVAAQAQAANLGSSSADGISATVGVVSLSVLSSLESTNYYTLQAQDDAASFVASGGEVRGPALEQAVHQHRSLHPESQLSDMDIASSMLIGSLD